MADEKWLIDANLLVRDINADPYRTESEKSYDRCLVHRQPTVDAVEVVRCKDCKKWERTEPYRNYGYCHHTGFHLRIPHVMNDKFFHPLTKTTDFCSYGERRTDHDPG